MTRAGARVAALAGTLAALGPEPPALADAGPPRNAERRAEPHGLVRVLTGLEDTRACTPLATGGFAIATGGGLAIVGEGGSTRVLTSIDGLPETRVYAVAEQGEGLWVGTEAGAAFVSLAGDAPTVKRVVGGEPVQAVYVSPGGPTYLGTRGAGVVAIDSPEAPPRTVPSAAGGRCVTAIAESAGTLYVAYADGPLARRDGDELRALPDSPAHGHALAAIDGFLLLGDLEGLFRVSPDGGFTSIASVDARGIATSGDALLVATLGAGLQAGTVRGALRTVPGVPALARGVGVRGAARCVATAEGVFVGGTTETGPAVHRMRLGGLPSNDITAIAASEGARVAFGTFDCGAFFVDGERSTAVPGIDPHESVNELAWQGDRLWVATAHGLARVDAHSTRRFDSSDGLPSTSVRAISVLSRDRIVVGTDSGAAFVETRAGGDRVVPLVAPLARGSKQARAPVSSPMHATWAVASGPDGTLYLGTNAGLYYGKDGRFARASVAGGALQDDWVTALAVKGGDRPEGESAGAPPARRPILFVGTYSKGVTRLRFGAGSPQATHLGGGYINASGLALRGGLLYAATMDGARVRAVADDAGSWSTLAAPSPGRDVTALAFLGDELWVASRRGIAVGAEATAARAFSTSLR